MSHSLTAHPTSEQGNPVSPDETGVLVRMLVRSAIDEAGWKHEAVALHLSHVTGRAINGSYLARILSGEKPLPTELIAALPEDVRATFFDCGAQAHGRIVVPPGDDGEVALETLVRGLVGLLRPLLPAKASRMARAGLERRNGDDRRKAG